MPGRKLPEELLRPDIDLLLNSLRKSLQGRGDGELATDHYLCAYNQLISLFRLFGKGPSKPLGDANKAVRALEIRRVSGAGCHYRRMSSLLQHEHEEGTHRGSVHLMSGTSAVGAMHEALPYMLAFLQQLLHAVETDHKFTAAQKVKAYSDTLGKNHTFITRTADKLALANSPSAAKLLKKLGTCCPDDKPPQEVLREIVEAMEEVHGEMRKVVKEYGQGQQQQRMEEVEEEVKG